MPGRKHVRLTEAAIARLRPREREYTVWDRSVPGLGVRVRPTGGRSYVLLQEIDGRSKRISLGPVFLKTIAEVRRECHERKASPEPEREARASRVVPLFRHFVEGPWKEVHFERYRPSTRKGVRSVLSAQLLPTFGSKPLDRITTARVRRWFEAFSRSAPGNANHALKVFRQIMNFAVARDLVDTNPAQGVKPNRRPALTRFLSREEISRLHEVLDEQSRCVERLQPQADIIRLLLLTGCRRGEIVRLRWSEVRGDMLVLAETKTGPRRVPLNTQARRILDRQPRGDGPYVFPSPLDPSRPRSDSLALWYRVRQEAGIEDVRLHDLRHTHASHAVMNGVPIPVVSRMLGHSSVRMTMRYAHLGDREIEAAAERVGRSVGNLLGL